MSEFPAAWTEPLRGALAEDDVAEDITTQWSVPQGLRVQAEFITRQTGVVAGLAAVEAVFAQVDPEVEVKAQVTGGAEVFPG
ncbi:hypothetical protein AB0D78_20660 [Streptomyces avermitilis]|uniref:hypothetical protein n=1 Tax=Streptomyces avermitilis TaxID=33903 RepID=UPI0033CC174A